MTKLHPQLAGRLLGLALIALFLGTQPVPGQAPSTVSSEVELRLAFFADSTIDADSATLHHALDTWVTTIAPRETTKVGVKIVSRSEDWQKAITSGTHNIYGLYAYQMLALEKDEDLLRPFLSTLEGESEKSTLLLVSRRADNIRAPEDLRDKRVLVNTGGLGDLPLMWLATEIATATTPENMQDFCAVIPVDSTSRALLPVYFGQVDTCVVTKEEFVKQAELNPEIYKRLDYSSFKSRPLLVSIFAFHRDFDPVRAELATTAAARKSSSIETARLANLVHRTGLTPYEESTIQSLRELYEDFNSIFPSAPPAEENADKKGPTDGGKNTPKSR